MKVNLKKLNIGYWSEEGTRVDKYILALVFLIKHILALQRTRLICLVS